MTTTTTTTTTMPTGTTLKSLLRAHGSTADRVRRLPGSPTSPCWDVSERDGLRPLGKMSCTGGTWHVYRYTGPMGSGMGTSASFDNPAAACRYLATGEK